MTVTIVFKTKPGTISYKVFVSSVLPQMITVIAPTIIPESATAAVIFLPYKVNKMIGPNEAPNPAHANDTSFNNVAFFAKARNSETMDNKSTASLTIHTYHLSDASDLITALYKSSTKAEEVTINCEEIVLITAAKIAASMIPAINGWKIICPSSINTASLSTRVSAGFC